MAGEKLSRDRLGTAEAILGVGMIVLRQLSDDGIATVFINEAGEVEICPRGEFELDAVPLDDALAALLDRGYSDEQLHAYIQGRTARGALHG